MRWRRLLLAGVIALALAGTWQFTALVITGAKLLQHGRAFDWWAGRIERSTVTIGTIPADIYANSRPGLPLLLIPGVAESGKANLQVQSSAQAFAGWGFRVVVPEFPRLTKQNVTPADIDDIEFVFKSLHADAGIACVSYGCGPALIAASRPDISRRVRFVVAFGSYFDLTSTLRFIVTSPPTPLAYSKWLYMAANADLVNDERDRELLLAIGRERQHLTAEEWTLSGDTLGRDAAAMLSLFESATAADFDARLAGTPALADRLERLSPSRYFEGLRARLIIVHLGSDPSIPSIESRRMAEAASNLGISHSLTVLNMYGHTMPVWPAFGVRSLADFYVPEGFKLMRVLREVLAYA